MGKHKDTNRPKRKWKKGTREKGQRRKRGTAKPLSHLQTDIVVELRQNVEEVREMGKPPETPNPKQKPQTQAFDTKLNVQAQ